MRNERPLDIPKVNSLTHEAGETAIVPWKDRCCKTVQMYRLPNFAKKTKGDNIKGK